MSISAVLRRKSSRIALSVLVAAALLAYGVLAWLRFAPVKAAEGWQYSEVQSNLDRVVSLARMPDNSIVATLSARQHPGDTGHGQLVKLDIAAGKYTVLADGLYKPDGLLPYQGGIILTQEYSGQSVLWWKDGKVQPLMLLAKPESIAETADGKWLTIEDSTNGRLLEIDPHDHYNEKVLAGGFSAGEGVCVDKNQRIFVVDNKNPNLMEYRDGNIVQIPAAMRGAGFLRCTDKGIWITEDVTNNGRLWFYDYKTFHVIASHLHSPQSVLVDGANAVLVAEQGRSRLLRFVQQSLIASKEFHE